MAHIRGNCRPPLAALDPVSHRVSRVVVNRKRLYLHIPDQDLHVRQNRTEKFFRVLAQILHILDLFNGLLGGVDGDPVLSGKDSQPLHMVRVLVGDEHPVQLASLDPDVIESLLDPVVADPRVDEDVGVLRSRIDAVAAAAAGDAY